MAIHDNIKIGNVFNRLKCIINPYRKEDGRWYALWECSCNNHTIKEYRVDNVYREHIKSCGCLQRENAAIQGKKFKSYNKYDLSGDYGVGYTSNTNQYGENFFYFDLEDYDKIKEYCWCFDKDGYLMTMIKCKNTKMHRIIMNCPDGLEIDHIKHRSDGRTTNNDNRKSNLRICEHHQNCSNRQSGRNKSGKQGVVDKGDYWSVYIGHKGKNTLIGSYKSFEEAVKAREEAEKKYYGEYSYSESNK